MTYVVKDQCIKCKYMDCVEVCPVDCFYEGENMLVIHPDECIDCGVCEPECPAEAISDDSDDSSKEWIEINRKYAESWPNINKIAPLKESGSTRKNGERTSLASSSYCLARSLQLETSLLQ